MSYSFTVKAQDGTVTLDGHAGAVPDGTYTICGHEDGTQISIAVERRDRAAASHSPTRRMTWSCSHGTGAARQLAEALAELEAAG